MGVINGRYILGKVDTFSNSSSIKHVINNDPILGKSLCLFDFTGIVYSVKYSSYHKSLNYYIEQLSIVQPLVSIEETPSLLSSLPPYEELETFVKNHLYWGTNNFEFAQKFIYNERKPDENLILKPFLLLIMKEIIFKIRTYLKNVDNTSKIILFIDKGEIGLKQKERERRKNTKREVQFLSPDDPVDMEHTLRAIHEKIPVSTLLSFLLNENNMKLFCSELNLKEISLAKYKNNEADVDMNRFALYLNSDIINSEEVIIKEIYTYIFNYDKTINISRNSWIKIINSTSALSLDNIVMFGIDIDIPFFFLMNLPVSKKYNFYVIQSIKAHTDPITKKKYNIVLYDLNKLSLTLNSLTATCLMLAAGSDYSDPFFSTSNSQHFQNYIKAILFLTQYCCMCYRNIGLIYNDKKCTICGKNIPELIMKMAYKILTYMDGVSYGVLPRFQLHSSSDLFRNIALITACMISTNISKFLRTDRKYLCKKNIKPDVNNMYMWFELIYFINSYINRSDNYFSLLDKIPTAHLSKIPTKILFYHTSLLANLPFNEQRAASENCQKKTFLITV